MNTHDMLTTQSEIIFILSLHTHQTFRLTMSTSLTTQMNHHIDETIEGIIKNTYQKDIHDTISAMLKQEVNYLSSTTI